MRALLTLGLAGLLACCWGCPADPDAVDVLVAGSSDPTSETTEHSTGNGDAVDAPATGSTDATSSEAASSPGDETGVTDPWGAQDPSSADDQTPAPSRYVGVCCLPEGCAPDLAPAPCELRGGQFLVGADCSSCLSEEEITAALDSIDTDRDGCSDLKELLQGTNRLLPGDCRDIDGDGIDNDEDPDIDGDGIPNAEDDDIDGDGIPDEDDPDPDGDGKTGADDPDEDGDGMSDRFDLDDDGDGKTDSDEKADDDDDDDEDEDDDDGDDDEDGKDKLLDLVERLREGKITEADRNAIANEIVNHFDAREDKADIQYMLMKVVELSKVVQREWVKSNIPPGIEAIDEVYNQLDQAIQRARGTSKEPLDKKKFPEVMQDFKARTSSMVNLAKTFSTLRFDELGSIVDRMRGTFEPSKLQEISELMKDYINPRAWNNHDKETAEILAMERGCSSLGKSFDKAEAKDLLDATARLRQRANDLQGTKAEKDEKFQSLLDRMNEVSKDKDKPNITDALEQVESEDDQQNGGDDGDDEGDEGASG